MATRPEFVRLANRIAGKHRPLGFEWNGQPAQFFFTNQGLTPRGGWRLELLLAGHTSTLELNRLPDFAWVAQTLAGMDIAGLPSELTCGLIEASFGEIFDSLTKAGVDTRITAVHPLNGGDPAPETIEWCIDRGGETGWIRGRFSGSDAAVEYLANLIERAPAAALNEDAGVPVPVALIAGAMPVALAELQQIEVHDVLLADLSAFAKTRQCQVRAGRTTFGSGTLQKNSFTLKQLSTHDAPMATNAPVDGLELELTFVVGQTTLTVGELRNLAPGFVFELAAGTTDGVTICANGKAIGQGELIEVGDRVGVRVTAFTAP